MVILLAILLAIQFVIIAYMVYYRLRVRKRFLARTASLEEFRPTPDARRYNVLMHVPKGPPLQLYRGYDPVKAKLAYEGAPMEAGCRKEFWEWDQMRGSQEA